MTNKDAKRIIEENKENTAYYDGYTDFMGNTVRMTYDEMYDLFRDRFHMGKAETLCIISALKLSGAHFDGELTREY